MRSNYRVVRVRFASSPMQRTNMSQFGRKKVTLRDGSEIVARDSPVIGIEVWNDVPLYGAYGTGALLKLAPLSDETLGHSLTCLP